MAVAHPGVVRLEWLHNFGKTLLKMQPSPTYPSVPTRDWLPAAMIGVNALVTAVGSFFFSVFFKENLGYSGSQIGILFAAYATTGVLATFPAGLGNDRVRSRTLVGISLLAQALGFVLLGSIRSFLPFLLSFFFWSLASSVFKLSLDVQVLKTDRGDRTGLRLAVYQAGRFLGLALGTVGTGYLLTRIDLERSLFLIAAACLLLVPFSRMLAPTEVGRIRLADYRADLSDRRVLSFAGLLFLFSTHWGAETTGYGLMLRSDFHLGWIGMGWYMSVEYLVIILTLLVCGPRMGDLSRIRLFAFAGILASGLGMIGMVLQPVALSVAFRALHGFGDGVMFLFMYVGIARLFGQQRIGGNTGFVQMATMLGFVLGSLIYGPLGERFGYGFPQWISGVVTLSLVLPLLRSRWVNGQD